MLGREKKQSCCKTVVLFNNLWRENKTRQKIRSQNLNMFLEVQGEKFFWTHLSFFVFEGPYHEFHITKKSETRRTC